MGIIPCSRENSYSQSALNHRPYLCLNHQSTTASTNIHIYIASACTISILSAHYDYLLGTEVLNPGAARSYQCSNVPSNNREYITNRSSNKAEQR